MICLNSDPENFRPSPGVVQCMVTHWWRVMLMMFMTGAVERRKSDACQRCYRTSKKPGQGPFYVMGPKSVVSQALHRVS